MKEKFTNDELFTADSERVRSVIRKRILRDNLIDYTCSECGSEPEWRGAPMSLVLDHINGVNNDHRLENLRFLCPNCNHQQPTYAGKNKAKAKVNTCKDCSAVIRRESARCKSCSVKYRHSQK